MLIDMHSHVFPDAIAPKAIASLSKTANLVPVTDGTIADTVRKMKEWGVDKFAVLNIATNPRQQTNVNNFAAQIKSDSVISFGSVHFQSENALDELDRIVELGLSGIKMHPDYQGFKITDRRLFPVYEKISSLGLPLVFHTGYDPLSPYEVHATPLMIAEVADNFPNLKIICAHFGAMSLFDDVEKVLVGRNIFFDTSFVAGKISREQAKRIIDRHGAENILFGSDSPWQSPVENFEFFDSLDITGEQKELIFHRNAERLLGL